MRNEKTPPITNSYTKGDKEKDDKIRDGNKKMGLVNNLGVENFKLDFWTKIITWPLLY